MVSQHGDWDGRYVFLTYTFTNGKITLMDGDRMPGVSFGLDPDGRIEYNDHVFWINSYHLIHSPDDTEIVYYPKTVNEIYGVGIGYQAIFDKAVDQTEIMDLLLSLEIK